MIRRSSNLNFFGTVFVLLLCIVFRPHYIHSQSHQIHDTKAEASNPAVPAGSVYLLPEGMLGFAYSLFSEGDYIRAAGEFQRIRFLFPDEEPERMLLMIGMSYQRAGYFDRALEYFQMIRPSDEKVKAVSIYETALTFLLMQEYERALSFIKKENPESVSELYCGRMISAISYIFLEQWETAGQLLAESRSAAGLELGRLAENFERLPHKSPVLAGFLSAVIPGAGKMYAERWRDGLFSLVGIGTFAGLAVYNFISGGIKSVKGWVYTGLGGLFHIGNIYGAVVAAQDFNKFQRQRLEEELFSFIYSHY